MSNTNQQAATLARIQAMRGVKCGNRFLNQEPQTELKQLARKPLEARDPRRVGGQY